eukprot:4201102-Prymnesium_polylepis.2
MPRACALTPGREPTPTPLAPPAAMIASRHLLASGPRSDLRILSRVYVAQRGLNLSNATVIPAPLIL